jgi:hypothetical protein
MAKKKAATPKSPAPLDARDVFQKMQDDIRERVAKQLWPNPFFAEPTAKSQAIVETCLLVSLARLYADREQLVSLLISAVSRAAATIDDDALVEQVLTSCAQAVSDIRAG